LFALCSITSSVYRLFENIFHEISFFGSVKFMTSFQSPSMRSTSSCGGVGVVVVQLLEPVRIPDTLPPLLSVSSSGVGVSY
jgi:hypothetical protein